MNNETAGCGCNENLSCGGDVQLTNEHQKESEMEGTVENPNNSSKLRFSK
jgi:hypothetical protein